MSVRRLRVLHVASGFRPWVVNGLITYAEDLMTAQADEGHVVACFFPGRHYPVMRKPRLHRWARKGVRMYEWLNSPIVIGALRGTKDPLRELTDAESEDQMRRVVAEFAPDIMHVHGLGGLPSSILDVAQAAGVRVAMTLHDYFAMCPTVRLYDADGRICTRTEPGPMCVVCCQHAPEDNGEVRERTFRYHARGVAGVVPGLTAALESQKVARAATAVTRRLAHRAPDESLGAGDGELGVASSEDYQRRRDVNLERLNRCDALLAPSRRVVQMHETLGVRPDRLRLVPTTASHLETLTPRRIDPPGTVRFATLNVFVSPEKGSLLVLEALDRLAAEGAAHRFELVVGGWVPPDLERMLRRHENVRLTGPYASDQLDHLLDGVHVGIVPSLWEEVLGFVGLEFLAKGIPVIGNARGGIVDYTREGRTGWLNRACSAEGLAAIMLAVLRRPEQISELNAHILQDDVRAQCAKSMAHHASEVEAIYRESLLDGSSSAASQPAGR